MRELYFAIAVWGEKYVDTFLRIALPSFLAPGNIPACAHLASIRFLIITRPEDVSSIKGHPVMEMLRHHAAVEILPLLTPDQFEGNRYTVMARAHQHAIKRALASRAILSIPAPDHVIADNSLSFGLRRILGGDLAVNMAGPRAVLDELKPILTAAPYCHDDRVISIPPRDLVSLLTRHPHAISKLLYWHAEPFSAFPSALYWAAGKDSLLARYFHLHPIFVDLAGADAKAGESDSIDGSLLTLANIAPERVYAATNSDELCIVELSSLAHDPMGSVPTHIPNKVHFMEEWARAAADPSHIIQFKSHAFRFQGKEPLDWDETTAACDKEIDGVFLALDSLEKARRQTLIAKKSEAAERIEQSGNVPRRMHIVLRTFLIPVKLYKKGGAWFLGRAKEELDQIARRLLWSIDAYWHRLLATLNRGDPDKLPLCAETLFAYYDLDVYPISYDIAWFVVWADLKRQQRGLQRLQCVFIPCRNEATRKYPDGYDAVIDRESRAWRFQNICVPVASLLPNTGIVVSNGPILTEAVNSIAHTRVPRGHPPDLPSIYRQTTADLTSQGSNWKALSASQQGLRYVTEWLDNHVGDRKPIVITLRQYGVDVERNSALDEWLVFAKTLDPTIYCPIIVPDTDNSLNFIPGFSDIPQFALAAWNVGLRMAIYEMAYLNMFVNSGPGSLCMLNRQCRYIFFKVVTPTALASEETLRQMGFERNSSPSFATPFQKWVWEPDNRQVLQREFDAMVERIEENDMLKTGT